MKNRAGLRLAEVSQSVVTLLIGDQEEEEVGDSMTLPGGERPV